jgi:phospholipid transport system substrate-binding protein
MRARFENAFLGLLAALALVAHAGPATAAPPFAIDTPDATIATLHKGLIDAAKSPSAGVEDRYRALEPLIVATHDLAYIAEFALRKQWPTLGDDDRRRFVAAFQRLSVMTYASRFAKVSPQTFKAPGAPMVDGDRARVTAAIARQDGPDVSLEYLLQREPEGWRIINIIADGVSDLALKRAEYQRILGTGSLDTLIAELEQQTARLAGR